jgi:hypothetical protein
MSGRQSHAVDLALRDVDRGDTAYAAARRHRLALSSVYRALQRRRAARRAAHEARKVQP